MKEWREGLSKEWREGQRNEGSEGLRQVCSFFPFMAGTQRVFIMIHNVECSVSEYCETESA